MSYQVFKKTATRVETASVTIRPSGRIAINAAATRMLLASGVRSVLLLWDSTNKKIALKAVPQSHGDAFLISIPRRRNAGSVRAKAFLKHIGWKADEPVRLPA